MGLQSKDQRETAKMQSRSYCIKTEKKEQGLKSWKSLYVNETRKSLSLFKDLRIQYYSQQQAATFQHQDETQPQPQKFTYATTP